MLRVCALLLLIAAACGGTKASAPRDAGQDGASPHDARPLDGHTDMASTDAPQADAAQVCPAPPDQLFCNSDGDASCRRTWAEVLASPPQCVSFASAGSNGSVESRGTCGPYNVVVLTYADWTDTYYYDMASGQLVQVDMFSGGPVTCLAGPPAGIPRCFSNLDDVCARDAGADAP